MCHTAAPLGAGASGRIRLGSCLAGGDPLLDEVLNPLVTPLKLVGGGNLAKNDLHLSELLKEAVLELLGTYFFLNGL